MRDKPCLCDGRADIRCDAAHCDIAGPGEPGNPNSCRVCWKRLSQPPVQGPSFVRRVYNFAVAIAKAIKAGLKTVSEKEASRRWSICEACDWFNPEKNTCNHLKCGCRLRQKVLLKSERCPLDPPKW